MHIREATPADADEVRERLLVPAFREGESVDPAFNALDEDALEEAGPGYWLDHDDRAMFLAVAEEDPVAYLSVVESETPPIHERGPRAHVDGLYVRESHRREGLASRLLERAREWAIERGCDTLGVTVHRDNEAARRLYEDRFDLKFLGYRRRLE